MSDKLNGVSFGCGVACRDCGQEQREFCWLMKVCDKELKDLGGHAIDPKSGKRSKGRAH